MQVNQDALRRLDEVMARLQRVLKVKSLVRESGLTQSQIFIMRYLARCNQAKSSDVGRIVGLSPGAVTQVTDDLIGLGYVHRSRSEEDRRVVYVSLTQEGLDKVEEIRLAGSKRLLTILERLPNKDAEDFIRILNNVIDVIDAEGITDTDRDSQGEML